MVDAWQILRDGGLPVAASRSKAPTGAELAAAMRATVAATPSGRDAEALAAFVLAWRDHWPTRYARELGLDADPIVRWAEGAIVDRGRHLKLRRIAIENLATVL